MFDAVRNNKKIVQVFLALITLPFAFFGVESYVRNAGTGDAVARIGDVKISPQQFQQAMKEQQDRLRAQMGGQFDAKMLDKVTEAIIERIVAQVGRRIDKSQPLVDARLPDGSDCSTIDAQRGALFPDLPVRQ